MPRKKVSPQEEAPLLLPEKEASPAGTPKTPRRKPSASAPEGTSPKAKPAASRPRKAAGEKAAAPSPKEKKPKAPGRRVAAPEAAPRPTRRKAGPSSPHGTLVIVESPTKARTLRKILGGEFSVEASVGHVRDLPKGRLGLDLEHDFEPEYIQVRGKAPVIRRLKELAAGSERVLLASDPDREGEAIAWHLATLLQMDPTSSCRIRMHEITASGVQGAVANPEPIDMDRVQAQQSRRVLDRLVGYQLSPLLWNKVQRGLSAGRVQSVALRLVCEREDEIDAFHPEEYWLLDVQADAEGGREYLLRLERCKGKVFSVPSREEAERVAQVLRSQPLVVAAFKSRESSRGALPPFKTSTLQQDASRRLGFNPRRTMRVAQSLYEGVDLPGRGPVGLITYMRTDSLRLAPEALEGIRRYVGDRFGADYLPDKPNFFSVKGRSQDAHEAIRPTDVTLDPQGIREHLSPEQFRLYELIWNRTVASQMSPARVARTALDVSCGDYGLRQSGVEVLFDGWGRLWPLGVRPTRIPRAEEGEVLGFRDLKMEQRYTQPPARYTEAGLVKVLEEKGIGRPSTYATIVETLSERGYVVRGEEDKKLVPTRLGRGVSGFLVRHFPEVVQVGFTAHMEEDLDRVEAGELPWLAPIEGFWAPFRHTLEDVAATAERVNIPPEEVGENCPQCGKPLVVKRGRYGEFIACSGYPECRFTKKRVTSTGISCPKCGTGELVRRKATKGKAKGRFFYGCNRYPECDYLTWSKPKKAVEPEGEALPVTEERDDG